MTGKRPREQSQSNKPNKKHHNQSTDQSTNQSTNQSTKSKKQSKPQQDIVIREPAPESDTDAAEPESAPTKAVKAQTSAPVPVASLGLTINQSASQSTGISAPSIVATKGPKVIVVLLKAALFTIKTKSGYELASADTHASLLAKVKKDPAECRPDIVHHALLTLLDSPLNKAGLLQVYIETEGNQLIEVSPSCRIPRTFKRFAGLMVQLLHKLKIRSADSQHYLLRVIKNPVTDHLPAGSLKIGTSVTGTLVDINQLATAIGGGKPKGEGLVNPIVFAIGSHASGPAEADWAEKNISVSQYPLSAAVAIGRVMNAFESAWGIL